MVANTSSNKSRGRSGRSRRRGGGFSDINVTPFVDVVLVLLIVFMMVAPMMTVGVPINLPETSASPLPVANAQPTEVTIDSGGRVYLDSDLLSMEDLLSRLVSEHSSEQARDSHQINVRADGDVSYGTVISVMADLNVNGFNNIGLVTDSIDQDK